MTILDHTIAYRRSQDDPYLGGEFSLDAPHNLTGSVMQWGAEDVYRLAADTLWHHGYHDADVAMAAHEERSAYSPFRILFRNGNWLTFTLVRDDFGAVTDLLYLLEDPDGVPFEQGGFPLASNADILGWVGNLAYQILTQDITEVTAR